MKLRFTTIMFNVIDNIIIIDKHVHKEYFKSYFILHGISHVIIL